MIVIPFMRFDATKLLKDRVRVARLQRLFILQLPHRVCEDGVGCKTMLFMWSPFLDPAWQYLEN